MTESTDGLEVAAAPLIGSSRTDDVDTGVDPTLEAFRQHLDDDLRRRLALTDALNAVRGLMAMRERVGRWTDQEAFNAWNARVTKAHLAACKAFDAYLGAGVSELMFWSTSEMYATLPDLPADRDAIAEVLYELRPGVLPPWEDKEDAARAKLARAFADALIERWPRILKGAAEEPTESATSKPHLAGDPL